MNKIGSPCPFFESLPCQEGCWLWDREEYPGICSAFIEFPESAADPVEWYKQTVMSVLEEEDE